jgi:hypothetical protein
VKIRIKGMTFLSMIKLGRGNTFFHYARNEESGFYRRP